MVVGAGSTIGILAISTRQFAEMFRGVVSIVSGTNENVMATTDNENAKGTAAMKTSLIASEQKSKLRSSSLV